MMFEPRITIHRSGMTGGTAVAQSVNESWRVILFTDWIWSVENYLRIFGDAGHRIVCIVTSQKRTDFYIDIIKTVPRSVDVLVSNRPKRWPAMLAPLQPDLIVSTVFPWRITNEMIEIPRLGAVNAHPSLLPHYRGTMIPKWMAWNGETQTGWTVHRMVEEFDSGPIIAQSRFPIGEDDDISTIFANLGPSLVNAWKLALPRIAAGDPGEPQDESQATYYEAMTPDMQIIDWGNTARNIHNQVRAMSGGLPPHGAIGRLDGRSIMIHKSQIVRDDVVAERAAPGMVLQSSDDNMVVQCGDAPLRILRWEPLADPTT
jgi:methionyl-tRNA formyltransferase